ncbi:MAG: arylesterase [Xanthobacteraceae bacterium]
MAGVQAATLLMLMLGAPALAGEKPVRLVALGDSLVAGYGLPAEAAFPAVLESALRARGHAVEVINAGVSGDTAAGGLARLDWAVPPEANAVIVELGANDMLMGIDPKITRKSLAEILRRLRERGVTLLLSGMRASPNLGVDFAREFEAMYGELATEHNALLYPFFLDGVAAQAKLNQRDGVHPTAAGVQILVERILPKVEELLARVQQQRRG